jgi:hypothetical protein
MITDEIFNKESVLELVKKSENMRIRVVDILVKFNQCGKYVLSIGDYTVVWGCSKLFCKVMKKVLEECHIKFEPDYYIIYDDTYINPYSYGIGMQYFASLKGFTQDDLKNTWPSYDLSNQQF